MTQYTIATIADILALTPDQRVRCVADLVVWASAINQLDALSMGIVKSKPHLIWVDDHLPPGTVSGLHIHVDEDDGA